MKVLSYFTYLVLRVFFKIYFFLFGEPESNKYVNEITSLYDDRNFAGWFKKIRFWDAPYLQVEKIVPKKGLIYELGCGEGIFSNFMAISSKQREVIGIDLDKKRIKEADRGLANISFKYGDVMRAKIEKCDAIIMFHFLHHLLSLKDQEKIINKCIKILKKNGKIIVVEINNRPFVKYLITWVTDHLLVAWLFERKFYEPKIFFRSEDEWIKLFEENNLRCKVYYAYEGKPFSNIIIECTRLS